jgi:hypothetical protein
MRVAKTAWQIGVSDRHLVYLVTRAPAQPHQGFRVSLIGKREATATLPRSRKALIKHSCARVENHRGV